MVAPLLLAASLYNASIHGNIVSIDRAHNLLVVHHKPHAGMGMEMTMAVQMRDPSQLKGLQKGEFVKLRCDQNANPWICVRV
ncbi:MAG TPA: copper-binding protein [Candidatus Acidoferrum sp.]|jgi:Cu/Ag efflux protein CusF|nr:copper-binding protein [Candidatus Acidoferrum sp.]